MSRIVAIALAGCSLLGAACNRGPEEPDIDPCTEGLDDCDVNAACTRIDDSYECACKSGYEGDGRHCENADECALGTHDCDPNATCTDEEGGFGCVCNDGYVGLGWSCTDIDECAEGSFTCDDHAICVNNPGSYGCTCLAGFTGPGTSCAPNPVVSLQTPIDGAEIPACPVVSEPGCMDAVTVAGAVEILCGAGPGCGTTCSLVTAEHNGESLGARNCEATATFSFDIDVDDLVPGANRVTIEATDSLGAKDEVTVTVWSWAGIDHGLSAVTARRSGTTYDDLCVCSAPPCAPRECVFPSERTIFRDSATGAWIWKLTRGPANDRHNGAGHWLWNADGSGILFRSDRMDGQERSYRMNADGSEIIYAGTDEEAYWSRADPALLFYPSADQMSLMERNVSNGTERSLWRLPVSGAPWALHPDGTTLVWYHALRSGDGEPTQAFMLDLAIDAPCDFGAAGSCGVLCPNPDDCACPCNGPIHFVDPRVDDPGGGARARAVSQAGFTHRASHDLFYTFEPPLIDEDNYLLWCPSLTRTEDCGNGSDDDGDGQIDCIQIAAGQAEGDWECMECAGPDCTCLTDEVSDLYPGDDLAQRQLLAAQCGRWLARAALVQPFGCAQSPCPVRADLLAAPPVWFSASGATNVTFSPSGAWGVDHTSGLDLRRADGTEHRVLWAWTDYPGVSDNTLVQAIGHSSWDVDEAWLVFNKENSLRRLWLDGHSSMVARPNTQVVTSTAEAAPVLSPDGTKVAFRSAATGDSDLYAVVMKLPAAPQDLRITDDNLVWEPPAPAKEIAHYHVWRSAESGAAYRLWATVGAGSLTAPLAGDDGASFYVVTAVEHSGLEGLPTHEVTTMTAARSIKIWVEAEAGVITDHGADEDHPKRALGEVLDADSGGMAYLEVIHVDPAPGSGEAELTLTVQAPQSGSYWLFARCRTGGGMGVPISVRQNGTEVGRLEAAGTAWHWQRAREASGGAPVKIDLDSGSNPLVLRAPATALGTSIDELLLTNDELVWPTDVSVGIRSTDPLPAVTDASAIPLGNHGCRLDWSWTPGSASLGNLSHYNVYVATGTEVTAGRGTLLASPGSSELTDLGLGANTLYSYLITAVDRQYRESDPVELSCQTAP